MKKVIRLIAFILIGTIGARGQNIYKDYFDGEIYIKIKKEIPITFDSNNRDVNIYDKLSFLAPFIEKYKITKAEASFYFAKSDTLKRIFRVYFSNTSMINQLLADFKEIRQLEYAEKVPIMRVTAIPNDLQANTVAGQYNLHNINASEAWNVGRGKSSVVVAVVDNAIDINHRDLTQNVVERFDVSDNDANPNSPASISTDWDHGTHVSGIACARTNNGIDIASISYNCGLMAIKATANNNNPRFIDHGYEGIAWAVEHGAKVINCSWAGPISITGQLILLTAYWRNVVVVAAAGNDNVNSILYPGGYATVLCVASVNKADVRSGFSTFGNWVDVTAPGEDILSTIRNNSLGHMSGTSMASPLVAGLCGLVLSVNGSLSNDEVMNCVKASTDNINAQNPGFNGLLGSGRINAFNAVLCAYPCNGSMDLGTGEYTVFSTRSSATITSGNIIPVSADVTLYAASSVILKPDFQAVAGSNFHAYIHDCGGEFIRAGAVHNTMVLKNELSKAGAESGENTIRVYPNPSAGRFNFCYQLRRAGRVSIAVYTLEMKLVKRLSEGNKSAGDYCEVFDAGNLAGGVYVAKVTVGNNTRVVKLVVVH